jgi:aminoglycoside phosphotransferase (APT) family kinase protein
LYNYVAPSFGMVASKTPVAPRFLDGLLERASHELAALDVDHRLALAPTVGHYGVSEKGMLILRCRLGGRAVVLRIPLNDVGHRHLRQHGDVARQLHADADVPADLKAFIPRPILDGTYWRVPYLAESELSGISAADLRSAPAVDAAVRDAAAFISALHMSPARSEGTCLDGPHYEALIGHYVAVLPERLALDGHALFARVGAYLRDAIAPHRPRLVWYMGDFGVSNLIVDPDRGRLRGVIDWDRGAKAGLPVLDLVHLLASRLRYAAGLAPGEALRRVFLPGNFDAEQERLLTQYCASASIPRALIRPLCLVWWLRYLHARLEYGSEFDKKWMDRNVHGVVEYLETNL